MEQDGTALVNEVRLVGRVSSAPERREMPSGDELWTLRVVVPRPETPGARRQVDALECVAWPHVRAAASGDGTRVTSSRSRGG